MCWKHESSGRRVSLTFVILIYAVESRWTAIIACSFTAVVGRRHRSEHCRGKCEEEFHIMFLWESVLSLRNDLSSYALSRALDMGSGWKHSTISYHENVAWACPEDKMFIHHNKGFAFYGSHFTGVALVHDDESIWAVSADQVALAQKSDLKI